MTKTEIANLALNKLGGLPIASMGDDSKGAKACKRYFKPSKDEVLESFPWRCAIARDRLATEATDPEYEYEYAFTLPNDCLRVLSMYPDTEYRVEGSSLLADSNECYIKYIKSITNTALLPPLVAEAIATLLASNISYHMTHNVGVAQNLRQEYEWILRRAKGSDAMGSQEPPEKNTDWVDAGR